MCHSEGEVRLISTVLLQTQTYPSVKYNWQKIVLYGPDGKFFARGGAISTGEAFFFIYIGLLFFFIKFYCIIWADFNACLTALTQIGEDLVFFRISLYGRGFFRVIVAAKVINIEVYFFGAYHSNSYRMITL